MENTYSWVAGTFTSYTDIAGNLIVTSRREPQIERILGPVSNTRPASFAFDQTVNSLSTGEESAPALSGAHITSPSIEYQQNTPTTFNSHVNETAPISEGYTPSPVNSLRRSNYQDILSSTSTNQYGQNTPSTSTAVRPWSWTQLSVRTAIKLHRGELLTKIKAYWLRLREEMQNLGQEGIVRIEIEKIKQIFSSSIFTSNNIGTSLSFENAHNLSIELIENIFRANYREQ